MRVFLVSMLVLSGSLALAAHKHQTVQLFMKVDVDGSVVSRPLVNVVLGHTASVDQKIDDSLSYHVDVTPTLSKKAHEVLMAFKVSETRNGVTTLIASPIISTLSGQAAKLEEGGANATHLALSVLPTLR